jgi:hypothetical protein
MMLGDPISRYLQNAMSSLPTPFARLVYLTSMRDNYSGRYLHEGWITVSTPEEVHAALERMHRDVFEVVAMLPLLDLCKEIRNHFDSLGETESHTAKLWLATEPYHALVPAQYSQVMHNFFISQVRVALEVLLRAPKWPILEPPVSSPPPPPDPTHRLHWLN